MGLYGHITQGVSPYYPHGRVILANDNYIVMLTINYY